ncbi:MAG TPA: hypothetical protein DEV75_03820 [Desulfovibrio sp.]|jgi:hypothetical protein|nr:hypothetical protein [Desulfovibrio sp.]
MSRIERQHAIRLRGSVDRVFPMFTPLGELGWVDGWRPEFVHPSSGRTEQGMVFRTGSGAEETLWLCSLWNPEARRVAYARVTPASRMGLVEVACRAVSDAETEAVVRYTFTALSEAGREYLAAFTELAYRAMIEEWRGLIDAWLAAHPGEVIDH